MLKKRVTACAFALTLASAAGITGAASALSPPPDDTAAAATADVGGSIVIPDLSGYSMGFAQVGAESGWRTANTQSIQDAAAEAGIDLKFTDAQGEQESQIESIRQFIQQGVDIIAFSPVVETGWDATLVEAHDAGIPVVLTDRAIESDEEGLYVTFLGSDFIREGVWAGDWVNENFADAEARHGRVLVRDRLHRARVERPQPAVLGQRVDEPVATSGQQSRGGISGKKANPIERQRGGEGQRVAPQRVPVGPPAEHQISATR